MATTQYLSLTGLQQYDGLLKTYIGNEDAKSYKKISFDNSTKVLSFYKAIDGETADFTVTIPETDLSGVEGAIADLEALVGTLPETATSETVVDYISEVADAKITEIGLADVATSGEAADVTIEDTDNLVTATSVEGAIKEIFTNVGAVAGLGTTAKTVVAAINEVKAVADAAGSSSDLDELTGRVDDVESEIETLKKDSDTEGSVANTIKTTAKDATYDESETIAQAIADVKSRMTTAEGTIDGLGTAAVADVAVAMTGEGAVDTALPTVAQVKNYVTSEVADLEGAMHFAGVITRNEGETDEQAIARVITAPKAGDVVVMADNAKEYIFVDPDPETDGDESWREVGDEGLYVHKSTTIAGVDLQDNITAEELRAGLELVAVATSGAAADVTVADTADKFTATTVEGVLAELQANIEGVDAASYITSKDDTDTIALSVTDKKLTASVVAGSISETELSEGVNASLDLADSAVQTIETGATNGTIKVDGAEVSVAGLGSAAFTDATAYDVAGAAAGVLGTDADEATAMTVYGVKKYAESIASDVSDFVAITDDEINGLFA